MKKITTLFTLMALSLVSFSQDISGTYYVGEPNYDASLEHPWKRTYTEVEIKFDAQKTSIELIYNKAEKSMFGNPHLMVNDAVKKGLFYSFNMSNVGANSLTNTELLQIEPGVFVVASATTINTGCTEVKRAQKSSAPSKGGKVYPVEALEREFILGKDKARVAALCANHEEFEKLLAEAVMLKCKAKNAAVAEKYPLPAEGIKTPELKKEVHAEIQKWALDRKWSQAIELSYIKSSEWETLKEGSKVVGRQLRGVVIYSKSGVCEWKEFAVRQDYNGSTYGKSYVTGEVPGGFATECPK